VLGFLFVQIFCKVAKLSRYNAIFRLLIYCNGVKIEH